MDVAGVEGAEQIRRTEHLELSLLCVRPEPAMKQHQEICKFLNRNALFRSPELYQAKIILTNREHH